MHEPQPEEAAHGGQGHGEHDHQRVEEALEQRGHQQEHDQQRQEHPAAEQAHDRFEVPAGPASQQRGAHLGELVGAAGRAGLDHRRDAAGLAGLLDHHFDVFDRLLERDFLRRRDAEADRPLGVDPADRLRGRGRHDVPQRRQGHDPGLPVVIDDRQRGGGELVGRQVEVGVAGDQQVDRVAFESVVADLQAVDQGADGRADVGVSDTQIAHADGVGAELDFRAGEGKVQRVGLNAGVAVLRGELAVKRLGRGAELIEVVAQELEVDRAAARGAPAEDRPLLGKPERTGDALHPEVEHRFDWGDDLIVAAAGAHEDGVAHADKEVVFDVGDAVEVTRFADLRGVGQLVGGLHIVDFPERLDARLDAVGDRLGLLHAVGRRGEHDREDQVLVASRQVAAGGHQQHRPAEGDEGEGGDDHQPQADARAAPAGEGVDQPGKAGHHAAESRADRVHGGAEL